MKIENRVDLIKLMSVPGYEVPNAFNFRVLKDAECAALVVARGQASTIQGAVEGMDAFYVGPKSTGLNAKGEIVDIGSVNITVTENFVNQPAAYVRSSVLESDELALWTFFA